MSGLQELPWLTFSLFGIRKNKRVPPRFGADQPDQGFRAWLCDTVKQR